MNKSQNRLDRQLELAKKVADAADVFIESLRGIEIKPGANNHEEQLTAHTAFAQDTVLDTLNDREKPYGDFGDMATASQEIKLAMARCRNWDDLSSEHREALEMIATKISRILTGDPNHRDSWHDIAGYATLIEARCPRVEIGG